MNNRPDFREPMYPVHFEEEVHLRDYIKVLSSRWKLVTVVFLAIALSTSLYTLSVKPVYQAQSLLKISDQGGVQGVLGDLSALTQTSSPIETEIEILKSRSLGAEVVRRLKLDLSIERSSSGRLDRILKKIGFRKADDNSPPKVNILEVPDELLGETLQLKVEGQTSGFRLLHGKDLLLQGRAGEMTEKGTVRFSIALNGTPQDTAEYFMTRLDLREATEDLLENIRISQVGRNTQVIKISYQDADPVRATDILRTLQEAYIERDVGEASREASATLDFIEQQRAQAKDRLEGTQDALDDFKVRTGAVALSQEAELLVERISDMEVEANQLLVTSKGMDLLVRSLEQEGGITAGLGETLGFQSPEFTNLVSGYMGIQRKRADFLKVYTRDHPVIQSIDAQVVLAAEQIRATASAIKGAMGNREEAIRNVLETYRVKLEALPDIERQLAKLARDVLIQEKVYSFLLEKEQEVRIIKASAVSKVRVVDPATVPTKPLKPKPARNILLGMILGMMLGVGFAFFTEYFDDTIKSDTDVESLVGVPLYGTVQFVKEARDRRKQERPHLVIEEPRSPVTESFRILRTNILFSRVKGSPGVITVSSPGPGEGKSFVVANLAALSSYAGKSTLVIDADLRKPQQHVVFGVSAKPGLAEVLTGKMSLEEAIQRSPKGRPDLLAAGSIPPNPSELLGSEEMRNLLEDLKQRYEFIVLDSPPLGLVTDPALLMKLTDLGLVVARAEKTFKAALTHTAESLKRLSPDLQLGILINAAKDAKRYGYKYGKEYGGKG
ncbi:MAG: polysaccharide biosynthesis tyrosine autokinase [bacterium]|nr:polysaccharide biosynthesis tyrosine autokinase [bacterium]